MKPVQMEDFEVDGSALQIEEGVSNGRKTRMEEIYLIILGREY